MCLVDDPGFGSGDRNRLSGFGSGVRCCCWCRFGGAVATLGSGGEVFVEAAAAVLVETGATAGALVPAVAELGAGEAAGEMGGEAPNWWQRRSGGRFASVTEKSVRLTAGTLQRLGDRLAYLDDGCVAVLELGRDEVDGDDP